MDIQQYIRDKAGAVKKAAGELAVLSTDDKNRALKKIAEALEDMKPQIQEANQQDIQAGTKKGLTPALIDRLTLTDKRFTSMIEGLGQIAELDDPVNRVLSVTKRPNGLSITKVTVPIGVIGIIYESRPNVTIDAAALCLKAGNGVILRGGSETITSNKALMKAVRKGLRQAGLPEHAVELIDIPDRSAVTEMLTCNTCIDLIIPRGGEGLVTTVMKLSTIPVIKHYKGVCHTYVDKDADLSMAESICLNAKVQRPGVCNAMECMLVHAAVAHEFLPKTAQKLIEAGVQIYGCPRTMKIIQCEPAAESSWTTEYLDLKLNVKIVESAQEAENHINTYGSHHSDAIVTKDTEAAAHFLARVDSAAVYVNASTRFTDGGEFGLGAEMGISTDRIHARGPMGLNELTTYKYIVKGSGQIR